ncbi:MAG: hypothetical protein J6Y25_03705 [Elusimicrobiaceae bacterium]|nr:hypothetical protein [Elusimicrobiaceae bacterium]
MKPFVPNQKRAVYIDVAEYVNQPAYKLDLNEAAVLERLDVIYRALVAILYNFVPTSGHPGGSISSGRFVSHLLYKNLAYNFSDPLDDRADIVSYAAGHKALGLYALWALRNECARIGAPELLPASEAYQLRLEDLLGFRHNAAQHTPLFTKFHSKTLGGHPEPSTPFVRTSTGASGVGVASAVGLALAAADAYGTNCPQVHVVEGEGGLTAGRVSEALSMAATAQLKNIVFHIDWNQASIETERVTAANNQPGDYVQWTPAELFYMHDCNVIEVANGLDFAQIYAAQKLAAQINNQQPTAIIYHTVKGWKYGLEGKAAHGSGHKFCSEEFYKALAEFEQTFQTQFPRFEGDKTPENIEKCYWESLLVIRRVLEQDAQISQFAVSALRKAAQKLAQANRVVRESLGDVQQLYHLDPSLPPADFTFEVGKSYTTRGILGKVLASLNQQTNGTLLVGSADLYGSTGAGTASDGFAPGYFNMISNPLSRRLSAGGICEDGMAAVCSGISSFGRHIAISSSYGAFLAFEHVAARLHAIGVQSARQIGLKPNTLVLFNGHASLPTGEDGPTHADPQSLQLVQDNFPQGSCITATPLEVDEIWPLVTYALAKRPAVFAPFVIRPSAAFMDRKSLQTDPATAAVKGVYYLHRAKDSQAGTVFVQGAGIGRIVVEKVLPEILADKAPDVNILYVTSRELFELLPQEEQDQLVPPQWMQKAMGLTDFTLPTLDCWLHSQAGRKHSLYPHKKGRFLGSAAGPKIYEEAGMDGASVLAAIRTYADDLKRAAVWC